MKLTLARHKYQTLPTYHSNQSFMETQYDLIDIVIARVFDIDPAMLRAETRKERAAFARFLAFRLRSEGGMNSVEIGRLYHRDQETVRRGIRKAAELEQYDKGFRARCHNVVRLLNEGMIPYDPSKLSVGQTVRTRTDSSGISRLGTVTRITEETFTVESFENPGYHTTHRIDSGRLSPQFETSLDIIGIKAL